MMSFAQLTPAQQQQVVAAGEKRYPGKKVTAEMIASNGGLANQLMEVAGITSVDSGGREGMLNAMDWIGNDGMPTQPAADGNKTVVASAMKKQNVGKGDKQQVKGDDTDTSAPLPPRRPTDLAGTQRTPESPSEAQAGASEGQTQTLPPARPRDLGVGKQPSSGTSAPDVDVAAATADAAGGNVGADAAPSDSSFSQIVQSALGKGKQVASAVGDAASGAAKAVGGAVSNAYNNTGTPPAETGAKAVAATMGALEKAGVDPKTLSGLAQSGGNIVKDLLAFAKTAPPAIRRIIENGLAQATAAPAAKPAPSNLPNMDIDDITRMSLGNAAVNNAPDSGYIDEQM